MEEPKSPAGVSHSSCVTAQGAPVSDSDLDTNPLYQIYNNFGEQYTNHPGQVKTQELDPLGHSLY